MVERGASACSSTTEASLTIDGPTGELVATV